MLQRIFIALSLELPIGAHSGTYNHKYRAKRVTYTQLLRFLWVLMLWCFKDICYEAKSAKRLLTGANLDTYNEYKRAKKWLTS